MQDFKYQMVKSDYDSFWKKYCGFLDLSIQQFMLIQQSLLVQQLQQVGSCALGKRLIGKKLPRNVKEFRNLVPLTTYEDYLPDLEQENGDSLPEKPYIWAYTSGTSECASKRVPYTLRSYNNVLEDLMTVFILACSNGRGHSTIAEGDRVLFNAAPAPYLSGLLAAGANKILNLKPVYSPELHDNMDFKEKIAKGFEVSLRGGVDIIVAMTSVLVKMGNDFNSHSRNSRISRYLLQPGVIYRFARALVRSKMERRGILPKDLWPVKALIGWGMDTDIYREQVKEYWGMYPYEFHACTEAGIVAVQSWNRKDMTFIPHSNFLEFIPEAESLENRRDSSYQPRTVLLSEVKPGERYELVITGFHGMPLLRYRTGHLIRITSLQDEEAKVCLPQMRFEARVDELIDIAGFTRLSERTVAQAIANVNLDCEDWSIRKEVKGGKLTLHLYMELDNGYKQKEVTSILHKELRKIDAFYNDLDSLMDIRPLEVTLLRHGTFNDYYAEKKSAGAELFQRKPPRMNAPDDSINELIRISGSTVEHEDDLVKIPVLV